MSFDSELQERAQKAAVRHEPDLYWENDRYIDKKRGQIMARVMINIPHIQVIMHGDVVAEFISLEHAKRWVEEQNL